MSRGDVLKRVTLLCLLSYVVTATDWVLYNNTNIQFGEKPFVLKYIPGDKFIQPTIYLTVDLKSVKTNTPNGSPLFQVVVSYRGVGHDHNKTGQLSANMFNNENPSGAYWLRTCSFDIPDDADWLITIIPYGGSAYVYTADINIYFISTMGSIGDNLAYSLGPTNTYSDYYFDLEDSGQLSVLNFKKKDADLLPKPFSSVIVTRGHCYAEKGYIWLDIPTEDYAKINNGKDGYDGLRDLPPGRYWISWKVANVSTVAPGDNVVWDFNVGRTKTCVDKCIYNGQCIESPAYCKCNTWWDGADCQTVFKGSYVLIVWGCIILLASLVFLGTNVWKSARAGLFSGPRVNTSEEPSDQSEEEEEAEVEEGENIFRSDKMSHIVRRQLSGGHDEPRELE
ncbi:hypothetical protein PROFUN_06900 [Planoprotostelium fungivorum]|uniref:EGF-like domain-containing protein n=1 Tax=Planoprotostelium fungivorum TaxID=1890364 RepID=A0A2P6NN33_9EUKA|nr:hypothetical protein PROFUN_06900 [Planoprotostelium fungivorum]